MLPGFSRKFPGFKVGHNAKPVSMRDSENACIYLKETDVLINQEEWSRAKRIIRALHVQHRFYQICFKSSLFFLNQS